MNWVDYILIIIFLLSMLAGFARGFVREVISLITLIAAFFIASMFSNALAALFTSAPSVQNVINQASTASGVDTATPVSYVALGISFGLLFAATILVGAIIGFLINTAFASGILGVGNRLLGGIFGLFRGFLITLVLVFILQLTPVGAQTWWLESKLVPMYTPAVVWLGSIVSPKLASLKDRLNQTLQNSTSGFTNTYTGFGR